MWERDGGQTQAKTTLHIYPNCMSGGSQLQTTCEYSAISFVQKKCEMAVESRGDTMSKFSWNIKVIQSAIDLGH